MNSSRNQSIAGLLERIERKNINENNQLHEENDYLKEQNKILLDKFDKASMRIRFLETKLKIANKERDKIEYECIKQEDHNKELVKEIYHLRDLLNDSMK